MTPKQKCPDCNLCMDQIYLPDLSMYWKCWLCESWFISQVGGILIKVESPLKERNQNESDNAEHV